MDGRKMEVLSTRAEILRCSVARTEENSVAGVKGGGDRRRLRRGVS
jgi:hypothetical protein